MELDRDAVERVLRRAGDLAAAADGDRPGTISEDALLAAADEVGLDPTAVVVSLAVERLGPPPPRRRGDGLLGPGFVLVERIVQLDADTALRRLDDLLVHEHQLRLHRQRPGGREWRRREGAMGIVHRTAKQLSGDRGLSDVTRIAAEASPIDAQRCVLRVVADRRQERSNTAIGSAVVGGLCLTAAVVGAVAATPFVLVVTPLAGVAAAGVAATGRSQATRLTDRVDTVLESVAYDHAPVSLVEGLRTVMRAVRSSRRITPR